MVLIFSPLLLLRLHLLSGCGLRMPSSALQSGLDLTSTKMQWFLLEEKMPKRRVTLRQDRTGALRDEKTNTFYWIFKKNLLNGVAINSCILSIQISGWNGSSIRKNLMRWENSYLQSLLDQMGITDFSLHSIGVIITRLKRPDTFTVFLHDICIKRSGQYNLPCSQTSAKMCSFYGIIPSRF